ncbi:Cysteine/Histidine-rich C1 domain family protein [Gossypium australe]|uniref:Cysteine/Histidine-rich C1 domain family protein n=1 Tax=Gossypium australe TaxID=47621 RepID=A0A5B6VUP8_9ROSI|nr:Cysteine/Histidine-rich C1 domain family protein [Gossypium australe]
MPITIFYIWGKAFSVINLAFVMHVVKLARTRCLAASSVCLIYILNAFHYHPSSSTNVISIHLYSQLWCLKMIMKNIIVIHVKHKETQSMTFIIAKNATIFHILTVYFQRLNLRKRYFSV